MTALPRKVSTNDMDAEFRALFHVMMGNLAAGMNVNEAKDRLALGIANLLMAERAANEALERANASQKAGSSGPEVRAGAQPAAGADVTPALTQLHAAGFSIPS